jgi:chromosome partitioning protein
MIITVGGEKGGAGKTTIAVHLAALCVAEGIDTLLVDADEQQTANRWSMRRSELHPEAPLIRCVSLHGNKIHKELADLGERYAMVIVDTGGRDSSELRCGLVVSDQIVLPVRPEQFDFWTLPTMEGLIERARPANDRLKVSIVLNQIPHQNRDTALAEAASWISVECPTLPTTMIPVIGRAAFGRANAEGLAVTEMPRRDAKAATEALRLYREIINGA